jgi:hypothetical protein
MSGHLEPDIHPDKVPEIIRAESRLAEAVGSVEVNLEELIGRLERVLRPREPESPSNDMLTELRAPSAQLTDFLTAQAARVESQSSRLADLLRRLAL